MRYGIISDIHANKEALEAVLQSCNDEGVRKIFCIGDVVGYGADPKECIEIIKKQNIVTVAGNHDWAVSGKIALDNFNSVAKEAVLWTQNQLLSDDTAFLNGLDLIFKSDDLILVHGTLDKPKSFRYLTDLIGAHDTFYLMDRRICFVGHTHVPQIYVKKGSNVVLEGELSVQIHQGQQYIVNVGSVGQPRDGNPQASYCIFDPDLERVEIKRVPYDTEGAKRKIIEARLPDFLALRLTMGQ